MHRSFEAEVFSHVTMIPPTYLGLAVIFYGGALALVWEPFRKGLLGRVATPLPTTHQLYASLDGFRGLAALWIALFHTNQWPTDQTAACYAEGRSVLAIICNGNKAVPIFVVLSGFLIWRSVTKIESLKGFQSYARNRALRIMPLFLVASTITMFVACPACEWQNLLSEWTASHVFGNYPVIVPQFWSLSVEIFFYMAAPFLAALITRRRAAIFLVLALLFAFCEFHRASRDFLLWKYFFVGIACSEISREPLRSEIGGIILFGVGAIVFENNLLPHAGWFDYLQSLVNVGFLRSETEYTLSLALSVALMLWGAINSRLIGSLFSIAPLRFLGAISYSIFAWHSVLIAVSFPVVFSGYGAVKQIAVSEHMTLAAIAFVVIPALVSMGTISFLAIERPFLVRRVDPNRAAAALIKPSSSVAQSSPENSVARQDERAS